MDSAQCGASSSWAAFNKKSRNACASHLKNPTNSDAVQFFYHTLSLDPYVHFNMKASIYSHFEQLLSLPDKPLSLTDENFATKVNPRRSYPECTINTGSLFDEDGDPIFVEVASTPASPNPIAGKPKKGGKKQVPLSKELWVLQLPPERRNQKRQLNNCQMTSYHHNHHQKHQSLRPLLHLFFPLNLQSNQYFLQLQLHQKNKSFIGILLFLPYLQKLQFLLTRMTLHISNAHSYQLVLQRGTHSSMLLLLSLQTAKTTVFWFQELLRAIQLLVKIVTLQ